MIIAGFKTQVGGGPDAVPVLPRGLDRRQLHQHRRRPGVHPGDDRHVHRGGHLHRPQRRP